MFLRELVNWVKVASIQKKGTLVATKIAGGGSGTGGLYRSGRYVTAAQS
jgi:hypothetical protein